MEMNLEKMVIEIAEKILDDLLYKGKTLREWINLLIKFEKEYEILPMGKYPASISGCNMEEDVKQIKKSCSNCKFHDGEFCDVPIKEGCKNKEFWELKIDTRFICNTCKHKYGCEYYGQVKKFLEESPVNYVSCNFYTKE